MLESCSLERFDFARNTLGNSNDWVSAISSFVPKTFHTSCQRENEFSNRFSDILVSFDDIGDVGAILGIFDARMKSTWNVDSTSDQYD